LGSTYAGVNPWGKRALISGRRGGGEDKGNSMVGPTR